MNHRRLGTQETAKELNKMTKSSNFKASFRVVDSNSSLTGQKRMLRKLNETGKITHHLGCPLGRPIQSIRKPTLRMLSNAFGLISLSIVNTKNFGNSAHVKVQSPVSHEGPEGAQR